MTTNGMDFILNLLLLVFLIYRHYIGYRFSTALYLIQFAGDASQKYQF